MMCPDRATWEPQDTSVRRPSSPFCASLAWPHDSTPGDAPVGRLGQLGHSYFGPKYRDPLVCWPVRQLKRDSSSSKGGFGTT